jgi:hypothetical protein
MLLSSLLLALLAADASSFVSVSASYVPPARKGGDAAISVTLQPLVPDVQVDQEPAPRLTLDPAQQVLVQKPALKKPAGAQAGRYLGPLPVYFPVEVRPGAAGQVTGKVTFFYCSTAEGWCRKGVADVSVRLEERR